MKIREKFRIREIRSGAKTAYIVQGYKIDGTRVRVRFDTLDAAKGRKQVLEVEALNACAVAPRITRLTEAQLADAERAVAMLPDNGSLVRAVEHFIRTYIEPKHDMRLEDARKEFEVDAGLLEHMRPISRGAIVIQVRVLARTLPPEICVHEVSADAIDRWTAKDKPGTRRMRRNKISSFFNWCLARGFIGQNPVTGARKPPERKQRVEVDPAILSVGQVRALMQAAVAVKGGALTPYYAIHLFAGLRSEELKRLNWSDINLQSKCILLRAGAAKTSARRVVEMPANLVEWITPHYTARTPIIPANFRKLTEQVRTSAGIKSWVRDIGRHSAVSYHYAVDGLKAKTAAWAGHSPQVLDRHYRGLVTPDEAEAFWAITPGNVKADNVIKMPKRKRA
jgi:integrase